MQTIKTTIKVEDGIFIPNHEILVVTDKDLLELLQLHKNVGVMMEALSARMNAQKDLIDILSQQIELMQGQLWL